jgi:hypothetical protein
MAYTNIPAGGAIGFNWPLNVGCVGSQRIVEMISGEIFLVDAGVHIPTDRWIAFQFHKASSISIPGVIDLPYRISWCRNLDNLQMQGLSQTIVQLNQASQNMALWRRQLSEAEWQCLQSSGQAAVSGSIAAVAGASGLACLASGGLAFIPLGIAFVSGMACAGSVSAMEQAAHRGNTLVDRINSEYRTLYRLGQDLELPCNAAHSAPEIQSACVQVSEAFNWMRGTVWWHQDGLNSYLGSDLKFKRA